MKVRAALYLATQLFLRARLLQIYPALDLSAPLEPLRALSCLSCASTSALNAQAAQLAVRFTADFPMLSPVPMPLLPAVLFLAKY